MNNKFKLPVLMAVCALMCSCAASYKSISPESIAYIKDDNSAPGIQVGYHHNVLPEKGNKKYHRKELKTGTQLVALKVTNNADTTLEFNRNFMFYSGESTLNVVPTHPTFLQLKQQPAWYLLYSLITLQVGKSASTNTSAYSNVQIYPIGVPIALLNVIIASSANKKFNQELVKYSPNDRVIKKGETAYFLVGINSTTFQPISAKMINQK